MAARPNSHWLLAWLAALLVYGTTALRSRAVEQVQALLLNETNASLPSASSPPAAAPSAPQPALPPEPVDSPLTSPGPEQTPPSKLPTPPTTAPGFGWWWPWKQPLAGRAGPPAKACTGGASCTQQLENLFDMQYLGDIFVGGQRVKGVVDTGSFELVVFSQWCASCGFGARYNERVSRTFSTGGKKQEQSYGSGSCSATDGYDIVSTKGMSAPRQAFWLSTDCSMDILQNQPISAIIGVGPPGEPEWTARQSLQVLRAQERAYTARGELVPVRLQELLKTAAEELKSAASKPSMLENFGVKVFSFCFERKRNAPGWLVWNDKSHLQEPGVLKIPVTGKVTWGVNVKDMVLRKHGSTIPLACPSGCGAVMDTGTSLFAVPTGMYDAIYSKVSQFLAQSQQETSACTDLRQFPDLLMTVGGKPLRFPPSSYLGSYIGDMKRKAGGFVRTATLQKSRCHLLMMDTGPDEVTPQGPEIILGIPFFREYYTTFDLGAGEGDRSLSVSKSGAGCDAETAEAISEREDRQAEAEHMYTPRQVDVSKIRLPTRLRHPEGEY